jgi:hypothetical protein
LVEVVGNIGATEPEHIEDGIVNVGVVVYCTITTSIAYVKMSNTRITS